jgi:hypothetical protein
MITTQKTLRAQFWANHPELSRKRKRGLYECDTRVAFCDYVDSMARAGDISQALAQRVTLD